MADARTFAQRLQERLCREEKTLKDHGLHAQAAGLRTAITILIRELQAGDEPPPLEPST